MDYRILGRSGLRVSALALGTVELGLDYGITLPGEFGRPAESEAIRLIHAALDAGINLLDTARAYGESEPVLGRALHDAAPTEFKQFYEVPFARHNDSLPPNYYAALSEFLDEVDEAAQQPAAARRRSTRQLV